MPRLGLTTAGTAIIVTQRAIRLGQHLGIAAQGISARRGTLWDEIRATCDAIPDEPEFQFRVYANGYGLAEEVSKIFIWLARW